MQAVQSAFLAAIRWGMQTAGGMGSGKGRRVGSPAGTAQRWQLTKAMWPALSMDGTVLRCFASPSRVLPGCPLNACRAHAPQAYAMPRACRRPPSHSPALSSKLWSPFRMVGCTPAGHQQLLCTLHSTARRRACLPELCGQCSVAPGPRAALPRRRRSCSHWSHKSQESSDILEWPFTP